MHEHALLQNRLSLRGFANLKTNVDAIIITATATPASKRSSTNRTLVIVISVIVAASAVVLLAVIWLVVKRKRAGTVRLVESGGDPKPLPGARVRCCCSRAALIPIPQVACGLSTASCTLPFWRHNCNRAV